MRTYHLIHSVGLGSKMNAHTNIDTSFAQLCQLLDSIDFWTFFKKERIRYQYAPRSYMRLPMVAIMEVYNAMSTLCGRLERRLTDLAMVTIIFRYRRNLCG